MVDFKIIILKSRLGEDQQEILLKLLSGFEERKQLILYSLFNKHDGMVELFFENYQKKMYAIKMGDLDLIDQIINQEEEIINKQD